MAGGAWQAIAQGVTDIASSALGQWQANKAADLAWKRFKKFQKNKIQWTVADMKAAGLNPILAAGGITGGGGGGIPEGRSIGAPHSAAAQAWMQAQQLKANIANTEQDTRLKAEQGRLAANQAVAAIESGRRDAAQAGLAFQQHAANEPNARAKEALSRASLNSAQAANELEMRGRARAEGLLYELPAEFLRNLNSTARGWFNQGPRPLNSARP